ncbi:hypothetical protein MSG28_005426 [Choristoneura fumiferana]|uniref:Uncharacterized protein n=1 Tax=Choristoneura fumiferana TaxID=7141 RepID=A0ACC0JR61_CHOFU|nr:hypothetical protein MSG28_005426 [Choristoneura fumiferana]
MMGSRGMATAAAAAEALRPGGGRMAAWRAHAYCEGDAHAAAGALRLEGARRPARRAPNDVLVRVAAASINPIDLAIVGGYGARVLGALRGLAGGGVEFPLVPGRDFAGTVAGAAPGAALAPGARVWGVVPPHRPGSHAQYVVVDRSWVGEAPRTLSDLEAGGALYAGLTACAALRAGGLWPGRGGGGAARRVLLLGLGGVGQAALRLLARAGHAVVAAVAPDQLAAAAALGAAPRDRHLPDHQDTLRRDGPSVYRPAAGGRRGLSVFSVRCAA